MSHCALNTEWLSDSRKTSIMVRPALRGIPTCVGHDADPFPSDPCDPKRSGGSAAKTKERQDLAMDRGGFGLVPLQTAPLKKWSAKNCPSAAVFSQDKALGLWSL
ncbi:hypothetical protein NADFUDRAFT_83603 [Nadsonia fulvescens var. elongata DSM 6958]|uniref:Uncharacterized protein n=1 Tax=Nadsonia fulvescens var. elongata DSM 6958 TaxID=857566 RepID=A0A1E3PH50_9ASCO|nr:hypothetical protein NADFUDRAFT_83603 [Nadsonia fulvescens var. elongata DSM 6958]